MYWITIELVYISSFASARDSSTNESDGKGEGENLIVALSRCELLHEKTISEKFHRGKFKLLFMSSTHKKGPREGVWRCSMAPHCAVTIIINCCQHSIRTRARLVAFMLVANKKNPENFFQFFHNHSVVDCVYFGTRWYYRKVINTRMVLHKHLRSYCATIEIA
jgi:hypothetical protein